MSPQFKMFINHTESVFCGESRNAPSPVRARFRCRTITHSLYSIKTISHTESLQTIQNNVFVRER